MKCEQEKLMVYIRGELSKTESQHLEDHIDQCTSCDGILAELKDVDSLLSTRSMPTPPDSLIVDCLKKLPGESTENKKSRSAFSFFERFFNGPRPIVRWAFVAIVFFVGLGSGKLLFSPPNWAAKYSKLVKNESIEARLVESKVLRHYFLSVQTLLLDLSNRDDLDPLSTDLSYEKDFTREILQNTRKIKAASKENDAELYQLVSEIEFVLEEIMGTTQYQLAGFSDEVRETIEEKQILTKIQDHIS